MSAADILDTRTATRPINRQPVTGELVFMKSGEVWFHPLGGGKPVRMRQDEPPHMKPLAVPGSGHASYRFKAGHGYVMAAAATHHEAEAEIRRSLTRGGFHPDLLEVWDGSDYVKARGCINPPKA